jgi:CDP-6-deoxy-D-xylo-4-hexulose-3-dehydrase
MFVRGQRIEYGGAMIGRKERTAINRVIDSQGGKRWTIGPESIEFEKRLASVSGVKRAIVVNSGSSALLIALTALHLPQGSKIIIPACNFPTAFNAIIQTGNIPVIVDVDLTTLNLSLKEVERAMVLYPDVKAVVAVDIAGNPVDLVALRSIVGPKVKIVLDDCDGFGCTLGGKFIETYADVSCVSFHAAHIITTGEGGAVLTDDEELADRAMKLREWGRVSGTDKIYRYPGFPKDYKERYVYEEIGFNMKPLELQCAMGVVQLGRLQEFKDKRRENHKLLTKAFSKLTKFMPIGCALDADPCWFSFALLCNGMDRKIFMEELEKHNIECRTIFSGNITKHPAYKKTKYIKVGNLHNSDYVMERGVFLSCHPSIGKEQIDYIAEVAEITGKYYDGL